MATQAKRHVCGRPGCGKKGVTAVASGDSWHRSVMVECRYCHAGRHVKGIYHPANVPDEQVAEIAASFASLPSLAQEEADRQAWRRQTHIDNLRAWLRQAFRERTFADDEVASLYDDLAGRYGGG